jgi:zinc transport system ATP-binding protein
MIEINNLCFSYVNGPYILEDINLIIENGMYISVLGENGSAKSTLIKLVLGLLKPSKGKIIKATNTIGYVPQRLDSFNSQFPITVREIMKCHLQTIKHRNLGEIKASLENVSMAEYENSLLGNLSGGQIQKILIARALLGTPELLILDEPSTGIDFQSQEDIYGFLRKINKESNVTIVSVEHNLHAVLENSTHVFLLENGNGKLLTIEEYKNLTDSVKEKNLCSHTAL